MARKLDKTVQTDASTSSSSLIPAEKDAAEILKNLLTNASVLVIPDIVVYYTVETSACKSHVRCVLVQQQDYRTFRSIEYWPLPLNNTKEKLATMHKKTLALICAVMVLWP